MICSFFLDWRSDVSQIFLEREWVFFKWHGWLILLRRIYDLRKCYCSSVVVVHVMNMWRFRYSHGMCTCISLCIVRKMERSDISQIFLERGWVFFKWHGWLILLHRIYDLKKCYCSSVVVVHVRDGISFISHLLGEKCKFRHLKKISSNQLDDIA